MLARTQWTKPSLEDFIAWLESKDPNESYNWIHASTCACGQYATSIGIVDWLTFENGPFSLLNSLAKPPPTPDVDYVDTFGNLLSRALKQQMEAVS
jgi:hypothetical protein